MMMLQFDWLFPRRRALHKTCFFTDTLLFHFVLYLFHRLFNYKLKTEQGEAFFLDILL